MTDKTVPTVTQALSAVMEEVQSVKKGDRNTVQNYNFRGIDAVVNAVGPALRKHGVLVVPTAVSCESEHYTTAKGAPMRGVTLTVQFRFYGPAGDFIDATACGEASDSGDKAVPKAHSVAYRTLLLQALCIPTDEPDPDSYSHERAQGQPRANGRTNGRTPLATGEQVDRIVTLADELAAAGKITVRQVATVAGGDVPEGAAAEALRPLLAQIEEKAAADLQTRLERYAKNMTGTTVAA